MESKGSTPGDYVTYVQVDTQLSGKRMIRSHDADAKVGDSGEVRKCCALCDEVKATEVGEVRKVVRRRTDGITQAGATKAYQEGWTAWQQAIAAKSKPSNN